MDGDSFPLTEDCDDDDPSAYPGAEEIPYDGLDQDCDGSDADDLDDDGYGIDDDCDDEDDQIHPGADELCADEIDNNCDGATDDCLTFEDLPWLQMAGEIWGHKTEQGVSGGGAWAGLIHPAPSITLGPDAKQGILVSSVEYDGLGDLHAIQAPLNQSFDVRSDAYARTELTDYVSPLADYTFGRFGSNSWYAVTDSHSDAPSGVAYVFASTSEGSLDETEALAVVRAGSRAFEAQAAPCDLDASGEPDLLLAHTGGAGVIYSVSDPAGTETLPLGVDLALIACMQDRGVSGWRRCANRAAA